MAIDPYIQRTAQEMFARLQRGDTSPYQFTQPESRSNVWGETPKNDPNYGFKLYGLEPVYGEHGLEWVKSNNPNNPPEIGPDGYPNDNYWGTNVSPLTREQYGKTLELKNQIPGSFIDMLGRLIVPGSRINEQGGYYEYQPQPKRYTLEGGEESVDEYGYPIKPDWQWVSPTGQPEPKGMNYDQALVNTGIKNAQEWGGTIGQGGWSALKGLMSVGSAALGGLGSEGVGQLGGGSISIGEAIKSGATASDLVSMGFSARDIALNLGGTTVNSLSSATGLSPGLSSVIVKGSTGALSGAVKSGLTTGNWGQGALSGLANYGMGSAVDSGLNMLSGMGSGGSMNGYDLGNDDFGFNTGGLDTNIDGFNTLNPAGSSGGFMDALGGWGKIIPTAVGAGLGIYGQLSSSNAAAGQTAQIQAQSARDANQVQWDMFVQQQLQMQPWVKAGGAALGQLSTGLQQGGQFATTPQFKFDPNSVNLLQDPGYKFRLQSGVDAITAAGSAAGNLGSGNLGVALQKYGQDLGSQEYGAAYARKYSSALDEYNAAMGGQNTLFNRLSGVAGTGQTAANNLMTQGNQVAGQVGQNMREAGNALASDQIRIANAKANGILGVTNQLMGAAQAYNFNQNYQNYLNNQQNTAAYNYADDLY